MNTNLHCTQVGPARILDNCAGIAESRRVLGREGVMPLEHFRRIIDIHVVGTFNVTRLFADAARHKCALLARLLSQGQITGATETTRDQNKQDGRLLVPGQLAPHVAVAATKKSALDRQRLAPELAPRVDAPERWGALVRPVARRSLVHDADGPETTKFTDQ